MKFHIPNREDFKIKTILLDLNGTLTVRGKIVKGVKKRLKKIKKLGYRVIILTGNHRGNVKELSKKLKVDYAVCKDSKEKEKEILSLEPETTAAIGNARIDIGTFKHARISVLTIEKEGIHIEAIPFCDIIVTSINDALDLFIDKDSLIATMK